MEDPVVSGKTLKELMQDFIDRQVDMPADFQKIVDENFWDLLATDDKKEEKK